MTSPVNRQAARRFSPGSLDDTVFALASGQGRSAVAVIRISGSRAGPLLDALTRARRPDARRASLRRLHDPRTGEALDQTLTLWMPGPATFTGEDQAELHIHGGLAVRSAVLRVLSEQAGCRQADPGEFTRRAFLNGRLDLTAVEGVADLVDAETEAQRRQALRQLDGELASQVASWRDRLVDALALHEASLDFADEDDVGPGIASDARIALGGLRGEIAAALGGAARGERLREGFTVVIAGRPNAGKSTLLNAIARRDVAIVSPIPGTTRDAIEIRCDLDGLPVVFADTAGLRDSQDPIEREGVSRALARMREADLTVWLSAVDAPAPPPMERGAGPILEVATKADLAGPAHRAAGLSLSAKSGFGVDALLDAIRARAEGVMSDGGDAAFTRERHRLALREAMDCLDRALLSGESGADELAAEDLRLASRALGRITGDVDVEEILDRIFASFCIGK